MNNTPASVWKNPIHFLAFGFGSGAIPVAPGTFGTVAAIPLYLLMQYLPLVWYAALLFILILFGIYICHVTARDLAVHDHPGIVWDEMVGYWLTMLAAPQGWLWIVIGFVLFRIFDIFKPWPIGWLDKRIQGGLGIVLDDLLAAVYAGLFLQLGVWLFCR